jgi:hypothetical protein
MMLFQMAIYYQRKKFSRESLAIDPNHEDKHGLSTLSKINNFFGFDSKTKSVKDEGGGR